MQLADIEKILVKHTERLLAWRKRRRLRKKERQKRKNQIVDWVQALLWAAVVVLIVNQYLLQAYAVPSASMEDTILGEDRLFVDKMVYGPELVPGYGKLPGAPAKRGEIIVFLNPDYKKEMGREVPPVEELFNRLLYMLTFTLVNRDVNAKGEIAKHFLVKRLIGLPGEQIRMRHGRVEIKPVAENDWVPERTLKAGYYPVDYTLQKKFYPYDMYDIIRDYVVMHARIRAGFPVPPGAAGIENKYIKLLSTPWFEGGRAEVEGLSPERLDLNYKIAALYSYHIYDAKEGRWTAEKIQFEYWKKMLEVAAVRGLDLKNISEADAEKEYKKMILSYNGMSAEKIASLSETGLDEAYAATVVKYYYTGTPGTDDYYEDYWWARTAYDINPAGAWERNRYARRALGWYIPTDRFFPMGDNRDNSKDARYFGSVPTHNLLGRSLFRFWPLHRIGSIH